MQAKENCLQMVIDLTICCGWIIIWDIYEHSGLCGCLVMHVETEYTQLCQFYKGYDVCAHKYLIDKTSL